MAGSGKWAGRKVAWGLAKKIREAIKRWEQERVHTCPHSKY